MFAKISRSWALLKASAGVLRSDSELLVFPLVSSIATLIVAASFIAPIVLMGDLQAERWKEDDVSLAFMAWMFVFYLVQYFVIFFFNSALVGAAMIRLQGGDPTLADGLRIASRKVGSIFSYALIAATVGLLLRMIEERAGWIGRLISGSLGVAWTFASFLVVPVLVSQDVSALTAVKQSAQLLRKTWGENLVGNGGIGIVGGLLIMFTLLIGIGLAVVAFVSQLTGLGITLLVFTVIAVLLLGLVQAALSGIYSAALYRYASIGEAPAGFDGQLLGAAFAPKR